jgi:hypothetical protein
VLPCGSKELIAFIDCSALADEGDTFIQSVWNHLDSDAASCPQKTAIFEDKETVVLVVTGCRRGCPIF